MQSLEDIDDDGDGHNELGLTIFPSTNPCVPVTDEDSGNEDYMDINNSPGSQLRAEAEVSHYD